MGPLVVKARNLRRDGDKCLIVDANEEVYQLVGKSQLEPIRNHAKLRNRKPESDLSQKSTKADTAQQILDVAQKLAQTRGFNAFSYADIAKAMKMTKASLHYHFPSKSDLGHSLIERYEDHFLQELRAIDARGGDMRTRLRGFVGVYADVLRAGQVCLCGMLVAEFETLPKEMQAALDHYFEVTETWLAEVLEQGLCDGEFRFDDRPRDVAQYVISTLEGAMILARPHGGQDRFQAAAERLIAGLDSSAG